MIRTFIASPGALNMRDYFAANIAMDKVMAFDAGKDYYEGRVYHAFGANLTFKEADNAVSISGMNWFGIWKVKRELSHLLLTKLRKVKN
jgi:hypothetical protein